MDTRATRTRLSVLPVFIALILNVVIGPLMPTIAPLAGLPGTVNAAATVVLEDGIEGCMGVRTTPGSENTTKELVGGTLEPGGTAIFQFTFPAEIDGNPGQEQWKLTDCVFLNGEPFQKYTVTALENDTSPVVITFALTIPVTAPIGGEYCNYAKTTETPSDPQASNRKAGPACFIIGGALRVSKVDQNGDPLAGATFTVACDWPDVSAGTFLPDTILSVPTNGTINGGGSTETINSVDDGSFTRTVVTGDEGVISVNGPNGTVCTFTETAAPGGYLPPTPPANTVTLTINVTTGQATHTFVNTLVMPDVVVAKSASQSTVLAPYSGLIYTLTATNDGTGAATGVIISDDLDDDLIIVSATWDNDPGTAGGTGTCTVNVADNTISCPVGALAASDGDTTGAEPDTATATITVDVPVAACPSVQNQSSVSATNEGDDEDDNNRSDNVTVTVNCPDASVVKTAADPTIIGGDTAAFSITADGGTLGTASDVILTDTLPSGFTWTVGGADIGDCTAGGPALVAGDTLAGGTLLTCNFGPLAANETKTITLSATTTLEACEATISNTAQISVAGDTAAANNSSTATITVECPDASVVKDAVDATIAAGEEASFTVVVTAGGSGPSTNVVLTDENPADSGRTWTVSGDDVAACGTGDDLIVLPGEILTCDFGDITNGDTRTITITTSSSPEDCADGIANTAEITADDDVDESNNSDSASIDVDCPDLSLDKSASSLTVLAPDTLEYVIFVSNDGDAVATNAVISDNLDDDLSIIGTVEYDLDDDGTTDGSCDVAAGNVITCELGDLAPGATASVTITVTVPTAACAADLTNTASVAADNESQDDLENNDDTVNVTVDCPDVSVLKTATDPVISSTESASFSITVDAGTAGTASDVTLEDSLPAGFTWTVGGADIGDCWIGLDTTPLSAGDEVAGGSLLNCNFGPLDPDETRTITLSAETLETDCDLTISNTAVVAADGDTDTTNNESTATVDVECPDLDVVKSAADDLVDAGQPIGFSIDVSNAGTGTAFGVTIEDLLPFGAGIDWDVASVWVNGVEIEEQNYCSIDGSPPAETLNCDFGDFAPGDSATVNVSSGTTAASCETYENVATVDATNHAALDSEPASVTVQCPGLNMDKSADSGPIVAGDEASFTITVWNAGPADAANVTLDEDLPAGLEWDFEIVSGDAADEDCSVASSLVVGGEPQMSVHCEFGTLGVTDMAGGIVIRFFAATDRTDCGELENSATADATNNPGEPLTRTASIVVRCPTLVIDKVADTELITITGPNNALVATPSVVTWTLTYTLTNGPVTNAVITDEVPVGFEFLDASPGGTEAGGVVTWTFDELTESGSVTFRTTVDPETISRVAPTVNVAVIFSDQTPEDEGQDSVTVTREEELGGNPTPRPSLPNTAAGIGLNGEPITVPIELLAAFFIGSLGALALANVKARNRRR